MQKIKENAFKEQWEGFTLQILATLRDPCRTVKNCLSDIDKFTVYIIEKISLMSSIVINVPTRASLAVATKDLFVPWLEHLNIKSNVCKQISAL